MSYVTGPLAGALFAGGMYYGLSNLIQKRTEQHQRDIHSLSVRLIETPTAVKAPRAAAERIKPHHISSEIKGQWNREVEALFRGFQNLDRSVVDLGRRLYYGSSQPPQPTTDERRSPSPPA